MTSSIPSSPFHHLSYEGHQHQVVWNVDVYDTYINLQGYWYTIGPQRWNRGSWGQLLLMSFQNRDNTSNSIYCVSHSRYVYATVDLFSLVLVFSISDHFYLTIVYYRSSSGLYFLFRVLYTECKSYKEWQKCVSVKALTGDEGNKHSSDHRKCL